MVISATDGEVRFDATGFGSTGVTAITTGFDPATFGGDEIAIEGTQDQVNNALKLLQTKIGSGQESVNVSIDVQPGGAVYNPENGHFYQFVSKPEGISWTDARRRGAERLATWATSSRVRLRHRSPCAGELKLWCV